MTISFKHNIIISLLLKFHKRNMEVFFIFALVASALSQDVETNNKCLYSSGKLIFTCTGLSNVNKNIDDFLTLSTRMLFIQNSDRAAFGSHHHNPENYQNLVSFFIVENNKLHFEEAAFEGLTNLKYLTIRNNIWRNDLLKNHTFSGLHNLQHLVLSHNKISVFEANCFSGIPKLESLDLSGNKIKLINAYLFVGLTNLLTLQLEYNNIQAIEIYAFRGLIQLKLLDLRFNFIKMVRAEEFNAITKLETLLLSYNNITDIVGRFKSSELLFLQLDHNNLDNLKELVFYNLAKIQSIDLSYNNLSSMSGAPFAPLVTLKHLNLRENSLNSGLFGNLQNRISVVI